MKKEQEIRDLLDRYWDGETTLEEERALKAFFANEPVPEPFRQEAELFRALRSEQSVQMPAGREMRIAPRPSYRLGWWAAAASVVLLLGAGTWWINRQPATPDVSIVQVAPEHNPVQETAPTVIAAPPETENMTQVDSSQNRMPKSRTVRRQPSSSGVPGQAVLHQSSTVNQDTYEDPEKALEEIKAVLALVSNKINKSKKEIGKGLQEVEAVDILFKKKKETSG